MGTTIMRRTGGFVAVLSLLASVFVITAPAAFSQSATVSVGACVDGSATVSVALDGDGEWSFLVFDADNVEIAGSYTNQPSHSFPLPEGSYSWIVYETSDPDKVPVNEGSLAVQCSGETTTTVGEETTTTVDEETTTTTVEETTTTTGVPVTTPTSVPAACVAEVGDVVWIDENENGIQDAGEPPVPGVTVQLLDEAGEVVATTVTDSEGRYRFGGLCDGVYRIRFELPELDGGEASWTTPGVGSDPDADSNADASGLTPEFSVVDGTVDTTWDAGIVVSQIDPTTTVQQQTTTVPPVTASTLPFTGLESAEMALMGALGMIAGLGMLLLAGRADRRQEGTGAIGRW